MKIDSLRKRLDAMLPAPVAGDTCPRWEDARLAFVVALDGNRNAARCLIDALKNDRQTRSCPELIDFALISLEPFPEVKGSVVAALQDICTCRGMNPGLHHKANSATTLQHCNRPAGHESRPIH